MGHIELARWAELVLIAPASADFLAKLANGQAAISSARSALRPRRRSPSPRRMNRIMWANPATQANVALLESRKIKVVGPAAGEQACGEVGEGRMLEPLEIIDRVAPLIAPNGPLKGKRVLITAGPTRERIDPVRFISNRSSGKMGFAVAQAAQRAGAEVVLVSGPVALPTPVGVRRVDAESAVDMLNAVLKEVGTADVFISTAAVADYKPAKPADQKIKKASDRMDLEMERTTDILATVAASPERPRLVVGFAAETESVEQNARTKLLKKNLDMIAANEVGDAKAFECEDNHLIVLSRTARHDLGQAPKTALADRLIGLIVEALEERAATPQRGTVQARG